jgi:serine/threonine protein kinase
VGKGGFASVYKVKSKENQNVVALKKIKVGNGEIRERVMNEIGLMQMSSHANVVQFYRCYEFQQ